MKIFGLSDLHLSFAAKFESGKPAVQTYKPMDVFGPVWADHHQRIYDNWLAVVGPDDAVLMPGDTSWAMNLGDARYDFDFLSQLPGQIYLGRGNHDYWWHGIGKLRQALPPNVIPLHHDAVEVGGKAVCSTRAWLIPGAGDFKEDEDRRIYDRELIRLEMALSAAQKLAKQIVAMLHYMPCHKSGEPSGFTELLAGYGTELCIYGHLHGGECHKAVEDERFGFAMLNVSADALDFRPRLLWEA
jgi:predicted phosphohydrolase